MSIKNFDRLFNPEAIAVIGASERKGSVGFSIMQNLMGSGFQGNIFPVNRQYKKIMGMPSFPSVKAIGSIVDMAIIAIPIHHIPEIIDPCGEMGLAGVVIISSGGKEVGHKGQILEDIILKKAKKYNLRIIGPNCLGIINTGKLLNASFAHLTPLPGKIAFLSQSGAVCTAVLDFANSENIGFSHFVNLGSMLDVNFGDLIDYFGSSNSVDSIIMYIEDITNVRDFMSAARSVSRVKPIIAMKSGRSKAGNKAAASHTGSMTSADIFYDAAFYRAGILRVNKFEELFDCAEFLSKQRKKSGSKLTIITNAGGPGVMAIDELESHGIEPNVLSQNTIMQLNKILPENWSKGNPVDVLGDTSPQIYIEAVKICAKAPETDALLLICAPVGTMDILNFVKYLTNYLKTTSLPIFTAWIGGKNVESSRDIFNKANIVTYDSAERAVKAFKNFYNYGRSIEMLQEIPVRTDTKVIINRSEAQLIINQSISSGEKYLTENQAKKLLNLYGIPTNTTKLANSEEMAIQISENIGFPVVLKICSKDILHKSDCNGVSLNLKTAKEVRIAYNKIIKNAKDCIPGANIQGVSVQKMHEKADYELIIGIKKDNKFGPLILFGTGGILTEVFKDISIDLPPLNHSLARQMIERTKISKVLKGFRNIPKINMFELEELLIRTGKLVTDFPEIIELDINPIMVKKSVMTAVDARVIISPTQISAPLHLIISSYPWQYETTNFTVDGHEFFIRPILPSDADLLINHFNSLSPRSIYMRFFSPLQHLSQKMLIKLTQIDYDREIALVAISEKNKGEKIIGVCRIITFPDKTKGEFAMVISDQWQGQGIGSSLLKQCLKAACHMGIKYVNGFVMGENIQMLKTAKKIGFKINRCPDISQYEISIENNNMCI